MTKTQIIKKIEKVQELLNELVNDDIDELIEANNDKVCEIEDKAYDRESGENTEKELDRIEALNNLNDNLEALKDELDINIEDLIYNYLED